MSGYTRLKDDEWLTLTPVRFQYSAKLKKILVAEWNTAIACCDCGMVHMHTFVIDVCDLQIALRQDKRATAQLRRHKFGYLHEGVGNWKLEKQT